MENADSGNFYYLYLPIILWFILLLILIVLLLKKYTFGNWTEAEPNPYSLETFGMPRGVFRGIVTLTLLFTAILFESVSTINGGFEKEINGLMTAFQMMIAFYFGSKIMHHLASVDKNKTKAIVDGMKMSNKIEESDFADSDAVG